MWECDPVFQHCIELRKYERKMEYLIELTFPLRRLKRKSMRDAILKKMPPKPSFPKLPNEKFAEISEKETKNPFERMTPSDIQACLSRAIGRVFFLLGFTESPEDLLICMTQVIEDYIQMLINVMKKNASNGILSVDSLKVALPQIGLNFQELHDYYTQIRIKFHDRLVKDCKQLKKELKYNFFPELAPKKKVRKRKARSISIKRAKRISKKRKAPKSPESDASEESLDLFGRRKEKHRNR